MFDFIVNWRQHPVVGVLSGRVVEYLDVVEHVLPCSVAREVCPPSDPLPFQKLEEALGDGIERTFFDYVTRGAPYGPDDGTVAPWAVVASLPFAPEIVLPTIMHFQDVYPQVTGEYCFRCSFNLSFQNGADPGSG